MITLGTQVLLEPGDILSREGETNETGYLIDDGEIMLYRNLEDERVDLEARGKGSIVGELAMMKGRPYGVSAEALTPCTVFRISAQQIFDRFEDLDPVLKACIDASIRFTAILNDQDARKSDVAVAQTTLPDAAQFLDRLKLENNIAPGLARGEFEMVYQPIVQMLSLIHI